MANLNKVLLIGRLTADPEIRYTPGGLQIADMRMAVNNFRKDKDGNRIDEAVYVDVTAFGRTAELVQQYLRKGRQLFVDGKLKFDQWEDKTTGQKRNKLSVVADNIQFLDNRQEGGSSDSGDFGGGSGRPSPHAMGGGDEGDHIPF
jgi:single-strand DNA-binding protein